MLEIAVAVVFGAASVAGAIAGIRSRIRVRRLMSEEPSDGDPACTIDRAGARRFFAETRVLRAALEDRIDNPGGPVILTDDADDAVLRAANFERAVHDWRQMFTEGLDDEDREALADRGVTAARIAGFEGATGRAKRTALAAYLTDLRDLEDRMTEAPRLSAYR